jgi:hypothetical protein
VETYEYTDEFSSTWSIPYDYEPGDPGCTSGPPDAWSPPDPAHVTAYLPDQLEGDRESIEEEIMTHLARRDEAARDAADDARFESSREE